MIHQRISVNFSLALRGLSEVKSNQTTYCFFSESVADLGGVVVKASDL